VAVDLLISLAEELRRLVRPVERALENEDAFAALLAQQGHVVDPTTIQMATVRAAFDISGDVIAIAQAAIAIATADDAPPPGVVSDLIDTLISLIGKLRDLQDLPSPAGIPAEAWEELAVQLLQAIIAEYVESAYPVAYSTLLLVGVIEEEEVSAGGAADRVDFSLRPGDACARTGPAAVGLGRDGGTAGPRGSQLVFFVHEPRAPPRSEPANHVSGRG
jgi:hypothetical protein